MRIENTILFGKYQLGRVIGQGRSGTVWLATHLGLEEQRAIKRVPKNFVEYEQFRREALLLKELRHPGIPIVYDLEEDETYSYLIEEYLEGDSLYDLVRCHGHLTQDAVVRYGIQICALVNYLHSAGETPVLYLDLQPKNLLLCHEVVKLIDFDHAATLTDANEADKRYGTLGCCAPEQMDEALSLDVRTDVFAIGCILYFMETGVFPKDVKEPDALCGKALWRVIRTCLSPRREERFSSAAEVAQALEELEIHQPGIGVFRKNNVSSLIIALTGSSPGVGTTHLCLSLSEYLRQIGYPNLYEEHNRSGAARQMAQYAGGKADSYGIFKMKNTMIKPRYGEAVRLKHPPYDIIIRDYGTEWETCMRQTDIHMRILVHGGKWWDASAGETAVNELKDCQNLYVVYNHGLPDIRLKAPEGIPGNRCYQMPYNPNPFYPGAQVCLCWEAVLGEAISTEKGGISLRRFLRKTAGIIGRKIGLSV